MTNELINQLACEIEVIKQRNQRVESDKAWEISGFRISAICLITYLVALVVLYLIGTKRYWLNALIPVAGFYLSSLSLPMLKRWWIRNRYQAQK